MTTEYDIEEPYWKIEQHAKEIMNMYRFYSKQEPNPGSFRFFTEKQCFRDCLESMKRNGLIVNYCLSTGEIIL